VLDLYSLNEAGPVAVADAATGGHVLLQPGLYVEILDEEGRPLPPGTRGEVALTGGFNFCLPLLRYRTGDQAALVTARGEPTLLELQGRPPVRFRVTDGSWINNVDVTHVLNRFPLTQYGLHQAGDGALRLRVHGPLADEGDLRAALLGLFGSTQDLTVERRPDLDKVLQYTSDLDGATA
jgi:phenylacetate-CoA ligase